MPQAKTSTRSSSETTRRPRRLWRKIIASVFSLAIVVVAVVLWWSTTHVNRHGRFPKPTAAIHVPGGFLQATGMENGLHCICMRDHLSRSISIQFDRATYLGNGGYHHGSISSYGGFTIAIPTETPRDTDNLVSPHIAIVLPYWFLVAFFGCAFLYFSGFVRFLVGACCRRQVRADTHPDDGRSAKGLIADDCH